MSTGSNEQMITGGELVAKALKAEGIDVIYTLCGGHIIDIYNGCLNEGIKIIDVRHEEVAAHAADGYARMTGKPGCAVVTAGPGTTHAITGVANAFRAEIPMLLIGGQSSQAQHKMGSLQDLPHVDMMQPITKFASTVMSTERCADMVSMAFRETRNGSYGPSFLEIPRDILDSSIPLSKAILPQAGKYSASPKTLADPIDIQKAADMISKAERPCVLLGQQVWTCQSTDEAIDFVRKLNIPAYLNGAARGTLPPGDQHHFHRTRRNAFTKSDCIIIVGTPFDFRMGYGKRLNPNANVIQIDMDYRTVGKNRDITIGLVGHIGRTLSAIADAGTKTNRDDWFKELRAGEESALEKLMPTFTTDKSPISPYRVAWELNQFLNEDTIYIGDGGDVVTISAQAVQPKRPGAWMDPGPLGTLGVGVPYAIAAKQASPESEVLLYCGDGAFSMTGMDFEAFVRHKLPVLVVVGNNSAQNQIRFGQIMKYGEEKGNVGNLLGDVPFDEFAKIFGGHGESVREAKDIQPALQRAREAVKAGTPAIVNIWVDKEEFAPGTKNQTMYK
ncbi:MAG: thiamine pyrophosphate-binding protein [Alphaproteobacteria bacterium]|jgi:acetolactate synthase-1/2/3 large subunit|nr:thiamine pyrophosphate-binding protein [Alphaproteobacteria bacterium]|tara:strand:+ start:1215 stop:2891 length:1677 start_codon:yes stop_codon:yes gene_type:complete